MRDPRIDKVAEVLVRYSVDIQPRQLVMIQGSPLAAPLLESVYLEVLKAGAFPYTQVGLPSLEELFLRFASDEQLQHVPLVSQFIIEKFDARIALWSESNTKALSTVDPARQVMASQARRPVMERFLERAAKGELKWVATAYPSEAFAQDAEMSLREYEDFLFNACLPDPTDPIGHWQKVSRSQARLIDYLKGKKHVRILAPGTDLTLSIEGRTFINCDGKENFPDGEIFTGPVESSAEGHVSFTYPACDDGREVEGVELWFEKGKVVKATARKNEEYLVKTLDTDEGSRFLGEFAIGTNKGITKFTKNVLFDEKIGGTCHLAVGTGFPESGSLNKSAIHWDMVCDLRQGGTITVDDVPFMKDGDFVI